MVEGFLEAAWETAGVESTAPFPRMSYDDAMRKYGIDKPDLRLPAMTDVATAFTPENHADPRHRRRISRSSPYAFPKSANSRAKSATSIKPLLQSRKDAKLFKIFKAQQSLSRILARSFVTKVRELRATWPCWRPHGMSKDDHRPRRRSTGRARPKARTEVYQHGAGIARALALGAEVRRSSQGSSNAATREHYRFLWVTDFPMFE